MIKADRPLWSLPSFEEALVRILNERPKKTLPREGMVVAAVLIPLFRVDHHIHVLLTKRSHLVEHHRGEISFPGGKMDENDPDLLSCALRETAEEVGIDPSVVRIMGELDDFYTVATSFLVAPFVGMIPHPYELKTNRREIAEVLGVPLEVFFDPTLKEETVWIHDGKPIEIISYKWRGYNIWGATARILSHFTKLLSDSPAEFAD